MAEHEDPERDPRWDAVRRAAARRVPTPPGLVERVLRAVARGRRTPAEGTVARLAAALAGEHAPAGVRVSAVAVEDDTVQVRVSVRPGVAAGDAAETLRRDLTAELSHRLGVATAVKVQVIDAEAG